MKAKVAKQIATELLAEANINDDWEEIRDSGQRLAIQIIDLTASMDHLRAVYHRSSAMLTALFTHLDTGGKSYEQIAQEGLERARKREKKRLSKKKRDAITAELIAQETPGDWSEA